jgi:hypothetical protein
MPRKPLFDWTRVKFANLPPPNGGPLLPENAWTADRAIEFIEKVEGMCGAHLHAEVRGLLRAVPALPLTET